MDTNKSYKDLSRRALISLNESFDAENDEALLKYLNEHIDEYEGVRIPERIIEFGDDTFDKVKNGFNNLCEKVGNKADKFTDAAINSLSTIAEKGIQIGITKLLK